MTPARLAPLATALWCAVTLAACGGGSSSKTATLAGGTAASTTATAPATATAARAVVAGGYGAEPVLPKVNFQNMLELKSIPGDDGRALLLTKDGTVRRVSMTDPDEEPSLFMDIRDRIIPDQAAEEGLLGLAFAPDYATSRRFYLYYVAGNPRREVLSRFSASADGTSGDPASERVLIEVQDPFNNHNGGALAFGPDGMLYVGEGDGGSAGDPRGNGQNTGVLLGKIWRIDVSGESYVSPADNPFADGGGAPEVWAYGLRNPWRINFDAATGDLWAADVGQNKWEEVDRIKKGENYGWDIAEGNHCFEPASGCDMSGTIPPRAEYGHEDGCSITGGYVYRGRAMPELQGWYVYGDFCSGKVWAFDAASTDSPPVQIADTGLSIASFAQDREGELYFVSFDRQIAKLARN